MPFIADDADIKFFGFWAITPVAPNKFSNPTPFIKMAEIFKRANFHFLSVLTILDLVAKENVNISSSVKI
jgi:hypothetical protein